MKHLYALLIKAAIIEVISLVVLTMAGASLGQAIVIGAVTTIVAYLIGDMVVLPLAGNLMATIGDSGLAAVTAWLGRYYAGADIGWGTAILYAVVVGVAEFFLHRYLQKQILPGGPVDI